MSYGIRCGWYSESEFAKPPITYTSTIRIGGTCRTKTYELRSPEDIAALTEEWGFLPFFAGEIPGFSVEECCPPELWFSEEADGPWEWKGPVARSGRCVYGKFFSGRAGFISREWLPDFANFRRNGYDFDARYDDGLASRKDKTVYDTVAEHGALLSKELKRLCNYGKGGNTGFDTVITRLQMRLCLYAGQIRKALRLGRRKIHHPGGAVRL